MTKISHWWFNWECRYCKKKFKWLPHNDFATWDDKP